MGNGATATAAVVGAGSAGFGLICAFGLCQNLEVFYGFIQGRQRTRF